jgi:hypothetical protein
LRIKEQAKCLNPFFEQDDDDEYIPIVVYTVPPDNQKISASRGY